MQLCNSSCAIITTYNSGIVQVLLLLHQCECVCFFPLDVLFCSSFFCCRCFRLTFSSNLPDFIRLYFCTGSMSISILMACFEYFLCNSLVAMYATRTNREYALSIAGSHLLLFCSLWRALHRQIDKKRALHQFLVMNKTQIKTTGVLPKQSIDA